MGDGDECRFHNAHCEAMARPAPYPLIHEITFEVSKLGYEVSDDQIAALFGLSVFEARDENGELVKFEAILEDLEEPDYVDGCAQCEGDGPCESCDAENDEIRREWLDSIVRRVATHLAGYGP